MTVLTRRVLQTFTRRGLRDFPLHRTRPILPISQQLRQCLWKSTLPLDHQHHHDAAQQTSSTANAAPEILNKSPKKLIKVPDFSDAKAAYESKSTLELIRAMAVFQLCRVPILVKHSETLLRLQRQVLGETLSGFLMKATLFGHFCGGEDEEQMKPALKKLQSNGIGSTLDYVAEDDGSSTSAKC
jgi:hypothetical protein